MDITPEFLRESSETNMTPHEAILELQRRMETAIIGQQHVIQRLLLTLLCNGNCLLEGLPGLAKTRAVKSLARHLEAELKRVQFTPDLLPADITGSEMYLGENAQERFVFQPGPIFANLVLADEINRAPAKVQSALLEAMEERQVTVSGKTHTLPELFMVLATRTRSNRKAPTRCQKRRRTGFSCTWPWVTPTTPRNRPSSASCALRRAETRVRCWSRFPST